MTLKAMYVLWRGAQAPAEKVEIELVERRAPKLVDLGASSLVVNFPRLPEAARALPGEDGSQVAALVSARFPDENAARQASEALRPESGAVAGYVVGEAVPLDYDRRSWPDGAATPGIKQVTLLRRKPGLAYDDFLRSWHDVHTPLALRTHPLWAYNRNVVERPLGSGMPDYDGIVELMFRSVEDLTEPARFFGSQEGMRAILHDVRGWLDLERIEYYPMQEFMLGGAEN